MEYLSAPRSELIRIIYEQQDKIAALETQIAELRSRLNDQNPKERNKLPSWVKPNTKTRKSGPKKQRKQGFGRKLDTPTKRVFHSYEICPDCGGTLGKPAVSYTRQTIDIPESPVEVTEHVVLKRWCINCKKRVVPKVNLKGVVLGQQRIGIRLMSLITMLKEAWRQPLKTIQSYLDIVHDLHLSQGVLVKILHKTAKVGKPTYENLKQAIQEAPYVHADETGGRENGKNGYNWSFNTKNVHFLLYRKSRSQKIVEEVLEDKFQGVLVSDFYAAYNTYTGFHQRCWVHFLGDIKTLLEQYPHDKKLKTWAAKIHSLYEEAKAYTGPDPTLPLGIQEQQRITKQQEFENKLRKICTPWVKTDAPMSILSARAITFLQEMFVFVRFAGIPSDNNAAERALRHTVISRKISGGTRSAKGSETKSILVSLFGTWRLQNKNPLQQCQFLLAACP